jgi:hypothetical protein
MYKYTLANNGTKRIFNDNVQAYIIMTWAGHIAHMRERREM